MTDLPPGALALVACSGGADSLALAAATAFEARAGEWRAGAVVVDHGLQDGSAQVEIRASWTPVADEDGYVDVRPHVEAWSELMCTAVGLPPVPEGVAVLPSRRGQRGTA